MTGLSAVTLFEAYKLANGSLRLPLSQKLRTRRKRQAARFEAALRERLSEADECIRYVYELRQARFNKLDTLIQMVRES